MLATVRTGERDGDDLAWLQPPRPDMLQRIRIAPLSLGGLHALISQRLGHTLSRPAITRVHEISGGNPLYALELARALDSAGGDATIRLPDTLIALVRRRIGDLGEDLGAVLLVAALAARPTTDLVATATKRPVDDILVLLEPVEDQGIIDIDGHHIRFTHPLLAAGVAANATPAQRRGAHRSLAAAVAQPELQARHLALGSAAGEPDTLNALDTAAAVTRVQGAPATAAELVDLAIRLGGDTPMRRLLSANHHFAAGDAARARTVLEPVIGSLPPGLMRSMALTLMAGICVYTQGFDDAERHLVAAVEGSAGNAAMAVQVHLLLAFTQINTDRFDEAAASIAVAQEKADQLGSDGVMSQVLSMAAMLGAARGDGIDPVSRRRALELEDPALQAPIVFPRQLQRGPVAGVGRRPRRRAHADPPGVADQRRLGRRERAAVPGHPGGADRNLAGGSG